MKKIYLLIFLFCLSNVFTFQVFGASIDFANIAALEAAIPTDGMIASTAGYWTAGDGGGGKYIFNSSSSETDNNGTVQTSSNGKGRWLLIQENNSGLNPRQWGAKGDAKSPDFDNPAFVNMFDYARKIMQMNINGKPDSRYPNGVSINLGHGSYITTTPMPLFSGVKIFGGNGVANENANLCKWTYAGSPGTTLFIYKEVENTHNGPDLDDITIQGIGFCGKQDLTVGFIPPFSRGGQSQIRNSVIQYNGFRYFQKIDIFGISLHFQYNYLNFMPHGVVMIGAADCNINNNVIGGGGYDFEGKHYGAENKFVRVIELQSFGNSRFDNNYISGDFATPSPIPLYIENSHTSQFNGNWYDYSDGPCLQLRYCNNLNFSGGNLQGSNRNSPLTNQQGNAGYGENECAIFIGNSNKISIDKLVLREIPMTGGNQVTLRTWGSSDIVVSDYSTARLEPNNSSSVMYEFSVAIENGSKNVIYNALGQEWRK